MEMISPAELRDHTGEILDRVRRGDWIAVTDQGHVAAIMCPPPPMTILDGVWRPGQVGTDARPAALPRRPLARPVPTAPSEAGIDGPPGRHRR
jgi:antitoxin (DNA-binding transcriptional repressor) of toxin-antitoxin stability system